jgi:hypothetical protein
MWHPVVGELTITWNSMDLPADPGLNLTIYTPNRPPPPPSGSLLSSWVATNDNTTDAIPKNRHGGGAHSVAARLHEQ